MGTLKKIAISCGGTGGHFYPGLSIAKEIDERQGDVVLFLFGRHAKKQAEIAAKEGIKTVIMDASSPSLSPLKFIKFTSQFITGFIKARKILKELKPQALLAMGSFASLPPAFAAKNLNIPLFLHDGNARIGKANRFLSAFAEHLATAFPPVNKETIKCPTSCTGMPVRQELIKNKTSKLKAIELLNKTYNSNLKPERPTLLVFGGSQGAKTLNDNIHEALLMQALYDFQIIHLTGNEDTTENLKKVYDDSEIPALILTHTDKISFCYSSADLVISRSGGSTIAELTIFAKFAFLVPYPYAAENHQFDNAEFFANSNAGIIIEDYAFTPETVAKLITDWRNNFMLFRERSIFANMLAKPSATEDIIELIEEFLDGKK